jgi:hypothetical protein
MGLRRSRSVCTQRCAMLDGVLFCLFTPVTADGHFDTGLVAAS